MLCVQTWCNILKAVPNSRLVLKNKPFACLDVQALWLQRFVACGIDSCRVDLLPLTPDTGCHLEQYSQMDLSLDPFPYAGAPPAVACWHVLGVRG